MSVYDKLTYVLLGLAVLILITSWLRKRLFQGITPGPLRAGHLPAPLHVLRVRRPVPAGRRLVPGARLPPAAGAEEVSEAAGPARAAPQGRPSHERDRPAAPAQQALHAAFLSRSASAPVTRRTVRPPGAGGAGPPGAQRAPEAPRRIAGTTNTPEDECSVATMEAGDTRAGSPGTAMAGDGGAGSVERVARELLVDVAVPVERVAAAARVAGRVGAAATEEAQATRHREGDRHAVVVQAVVLLVRVHPTTVKTTARTASVASTDPDAPTWPTRRPSTGIAGAAQLPDAIGGRARPCRGRRCRRRTGREVVIAIGRS